MGRKRGELSVGDTGSPGSLSTAQDTDMGGKYLPGVMKSFLSPLLQHAPGPNISLGQVHTPSSLLHFSLERQVVGFLHPGIEGKEGFSFQIKHKELLSLKDLPLCTLLRARTLPASLTLARTLACHRHLQIPTPSPLKEVVEMQSKLWLRTVQSPWGQIRWCGMGGGHGRPHAAFPGGVACLTRSQGPGCTAERPEASWPHLSGGGKPGILETQWEGEKRAMKRIPAAVPRAES